MSIEDGGIGDGYFDWDRVAVKLDDVNFQVGRMKKNGRTREGATAGN